MGQLERRVRRSVELQEQVETVKPILRMHDPSIEAHPRALRQEIAKGHYSFKFPKNVNCYADKVKLIAQQEAAFQVYKKGRFE
jgi:hypothetical protein